MVINIIQVDPLFFNFRSYIDLLIFGDPTLFCTEPKKFRPKSDDPKYWETLINSNNSLFQWDKIAREWQGYSDSNDESNSEICSEEINE